MFPFSEKEILEANSAYAARCPPVHGLPIEPGKKVAIITCMDTNIDAFAAFGLDPGDAQIIRNAGGSAIEAVRSLVVSQQMMNTLGVFVVKHTKCGMVGLSIDELHRRIKNNIGVEALNAAKEINFLPLEELDQAVRDDVYFLRGHVLTPDVVKENISGWVLDIHTYRLRPIPCPHEKPLEHA